MPAALNNTKRPAVRVFVATTVLLSFISFWRAAAIVLSDLGSSAYYVGGDAEKVIGKSAPWFILAVMLFANCVRALYIESTSMFVRGGVYRVVRRAMGNTLAKFSVSALLFDYVLTGPLSSVVAGQYLAGFIQDISHYIGHPLRHFPDNAFAAMFRILVTIYFWWKNTQGIHESSEKALQIMIVTTVMVVILIIWCTITVFHGNAQMPPNPLKSGIPLDKESLGWLVSLKNSWISHLTLFIVFVGFGHSVLAMSGEETLAQVNREIAHPKLKNLKKAAVVIGIYALLFTALTSFFAVMIIPDSVRPAYFGNLISGIMGQADFSCFRCVGGRAYPLGRAKYLDCGREWRAQSRRRRWRTHRCFPETASSIRHQLPDHQPGSRDATADHRSDRRKRLHSRGFIRFWCGVELCPDGARGAGVALYRAF